jgi:AraC family transcriptional regulator, transcriptional activator of pobA
MTLDFISISDYLKHSNIKIPNKMNDFVIYHYKDLNEDANMTLKAYRHHFYEITLDINMGCSFHVDNFKFENEKGLLAIVSPLRLQSVYASDMVYKYKEGFSLFFHQNFLTELNTKILTKEYTFFKTTKSPAVKLNSKTLSELNTLFQMMKYEYLEYGYESRETLKNLVCAILDKAKRNYTDLSEPIDVSFREYELARCFETIVQEKFLQLTTIKEYAHTLNISDKYLSQVIKKVTGRNALAILNSHRVNYAKTLLLQTTLSSVEIGNELHFPNSSYFFSYFKKLTGQTPSQYRLENLK